MNLFPLGAAAIVFGILPLHNHIVAAVCLQRYNANQPSS